MLRTQLAATLLQTYRFLPTAPRPPHAEARLASLLSTRDAIGAFSQLGMVYVGSAGGGVRDAGTERERERESSWNCGTETTEPSGTEET